MWMKPKQPGFLQKPWLLLLKAERSRAAQIEAQKAGIQSVSRGDLPGATGPGLTGFAWINLYAIITTYPPLQSSTLISLKKTYWPREKRGQYVRVQPLLI